MSANSYCQTAVISLKSHGGDIQLVNSEADNFGMVEPAPEYDTVMLIEGNCIVTIGQRWGGFRFQDTICDHWSLEQSGYTLKSAKAHYGNKPKYIGFKRSKQKDDDDSLEQDYWNNGRSNQNSLFGLFGLVLISFMAYLITPVLRKK